MKRLLALASLFVLPAVVGAQVETYRIDPVHSGVSFKIRHFFNQVPGSFARFSGTITVDRADLTKSSVEATIEVPSVDTRNADRDGHLQNEDFFKSSEFPSITFRSTSWVAAGENRYHVTGDLTMVGQTHPVTLDVELLGFGPGRGGRTISGWRATATLDRTLWGITYGQPAVGKEVTVELDIQGHKQD